jgi:hypothetical protein
MQGIIRKQELGHEKELNIQLYALSVLLQVITTSRDGVERQLYTAVTN